MTAPPASIVVADANVIINLIHVDRLGFCRLLQGYDFVLPDHVYREVTKPEQRSAVDSALRSGALASVSITDPVDIAALSELLPRLGRGEAACLVLAERNGWMIASDERRRFRREALARIGKERLIGTAELLVLAIQQGLITVEEADADKVALEARRFRLPFRSFGEQVPGT